MTMIRTIITIVKTILEGKGYNVLSATGGQELLNMLPNRKPDLIILDLMLPDSDHGPTGTPQALKIALIAPTIGFNFLTPKRRQTTSPSRISISMPEKSYRFVIGSIRFWRITAVNPLKKLQMIRIGTTS